MVQYQLKLKPTKEQEETMQEWLFLLTGVWNWAVRKIELDAKDGFFSSKYDLYKLINGHGTKIGIPTIVLRGVVETAVIAWQRCFKKLGGKPKLKGFRNKLNSIPFLELRSAASIEPTRFTVPGLGSMRYHKQTLPEGKVKCGRIIKKASGWYLCLFIDAAPNPIPHVADGRVGIDPGFKHLLTLSTGEKVEHPKELAKSATRLAQAQRGRKALAARVHERTANRRKDRNHKLSRRLVAENNFIAFSADNIRGISNKFGKSVASASHAQLRSMINYKSITSGRDYVEVQSKGSTMTCSTCGAVTGPQGFAGLKVRQWQCDCGSLHDRDINAAINTLLSGLEQPTRKV